MQSVWEENLDIQRPYLALVEKIQMLSDKRNLLVECMKVLIVSHVPMMTKNNMGKTILSLFSQFERKELCQLYIYPTIPDVNACGSYFRVTDKDVLSSLCGKWKIGKQIDSNMICENQGVYEHSEDESFYKSRKNKSAFRRLMRDAMWAVSPWYGKQLKDWLDREQPDCIFVAPGVAKFLYNIALRIARDRNIPLVSYFCDEYYFVRKPEGRLDRLRVNLLKKKIRQLMKSSSHLVVISQELQEAYEREFDVDTSVLMTGATWPVAEHPSVVEGPTEISYFGNIRCNRYTVLAEIGRELDAMNREYDKSYQLKIYTSEKDEQILSVFDGIESIVLCGFVAGKEYERAFQSAQLLLHVEAFDDTSTDFTRHSVSTKIADSLACGIPLLAYGPAGISSMKYLQRNECAVMTASREELRTMLLTAFENEEVRHRAAENGLAAAKVYHDSWIAGRKMREIMMNLDC